MFVIAVKSRTKRILIIKVEDFEPGIPRLAALFSLDETIGIYQCFSRQANRIILRRMIKLNKLEKEQRELDLCDAADPDRSKLYTVETSGENDSARIQLEQQIERGVEELCKTNSNQDR